MYAIIKRCFDIILSLLLLILLSPLLMVIILTIRLTSSGPAVFSQIRSGKNEKRFVIYKFRTMSMRAPDNVSTENLTSSHRYITPVGKFLRQSSLDELPQLFNVLKGDMSFVGPRPVIPSEKILLALRRRNGASRVRPGITGLAQIRGRDTLDVIAKSRYDALYAHRCCFCLDIYILLHTVKCVLRREGIREGHAE